MLGLLSEAVAKSGVQYLMETAGIAKPSGIRGV